MAHICRLRLGGPFSAGKEPEMEQVQYQGIHTKR